MKVDSTFTDISLEAPAIAVRSTRPGLTRPLAQVPFAQIRFARGHGAGRQAGGPGLRRSGSATPI
jgi:hypothetical protein